MPDAIDKDAPEQNRTARVAIAWADGRGEAEGGKYPFRLGIGELRELQQLTDCGPREIARRLQTGQERADDVFETLRCGLIGGGMAPAKALDLVKRYGHERPLIESIPAAHAVILAAIIGAPEEGVGTKKDEAADPTTETTNSQTESSGLPPSTQPASPSAAPSPTPAQSTA